MKTLIIALSLCLLVSVVWAGDAKIIEKYQKRVVDQDVLVFVSNEYRKDDPLYKKGDNHYYIQYFSGDHKVIGLRRDKSLPELLDEIVADIKKQDYGI